MHGCETEGTGILNMKNTLARISSWGNVDHSDDWNRPVDEIELVIERKYRKD